jgi:hypothetical protein
MKWVSCILGQICRTEKLGESPNFFVTILHPFSFFIELEEIADFWVFLFALCIGVSCFGFVNLAFLECCPYVIAIVAI